MKRFAFANVLFDQESFDVLKELLRKKSAVYSPDDKRSFTRGGSSRAAEETIAARMHREALNRIFDQIRDVTYESALPGLDYE